MVLKSLLAQFWEEPDTTQPPASHLQLRQTLLTLEENVPTKSTRSIPERKVVLAGGKAPAHREKGVGGGGGEENPRRNCTCLSNNIGRASALPDPRCQGDLGRPCGLTDAKVT